MCGIVAYVGHREAGEFLLEGLRRLEYRGYDSAVIATLTPDRRFHVVKAVEKKAKANAKAKAQKPARHKAG